MSAITDRFCRARQLSRELFPQWSRRMRARWVLAKLSAPAHKLRVSAGWCYDRNAYRYRRTA